MPAAVSRVILPGQFVETREEDRAVVAEIRIGAAVGMPARDRQVGVEGERRRPDRSEAEDPSLSVGRGGHRAEAEGQAGRGRQAHAGNFRRAGRGDPAQQQGAGIVE